MAGPSFAAYVLAGGRSTRMGQDKALLPLAGKPLIERAVAKLRRLTPDVRILGSRAELAPFAPLVPDLHPGCGPIAGLEAALTHSSHEWSLVVPVDMPFLPAALLRYWTDAVLNQPAARISFFVVDQIPQPALCLLHREILPFLSASLQQGSYKLTPVLEEGATALAHRQGVSPDGVLLRYPWYPAEALQLFAQLASDPAEGKRTEGLTQVQRAASHLWFENLNTPEQFAEAQLHLDALDS
jgi:molybdopterin-guanine dinucleotide biosynthesis protein A